MRFVAFILCLLLISCQRDEAQQICSTSDLVADLTWLQDLTQHITENPDQYHSVIITRFNYRNQTVFDVYDMISSCVYCDLRDCSGNKFTPENFNDFIVNKTGEQKIWCQNPALCQ